MSETEPTDPPPSDRKSGSLLQMHRQTVDTSKGMSPAVLLGSSMALAMGLFAWGGMKIDERYDSEPWGILGGVLLGLLFGVYEVWKVVRTPDKVEPLPPESDRS